MKPADMINRIDKEIKNKLSAINLDHYYAELRDAVPSDTHVFLYHAVREIIWRRDIDERADFPETVIDGAHLVIGPMKWTYPRFQILSLILAYLPPLMVLSLVLLVDPLQLSRLAAMSLELAFRSQIPLIRNLCLTVFPNVSLLILLLTIHAKCRNSVGFVAGTVLSTLLSYLSMWMCHLILGFLLRLTQNLDVMNYVESILDALRI